ncbi:ATP-binding protein [uncultured Brevundimonas sp.]|uniref:sensor histidine kinase n=1 Tax=uncultured Brevundimonas sp. TaxID=213418 RepID=UPI0025FA19C7|nr:ATP-binding protein [uncultured Brevundimonas sp.]
MRVHVSAQMPGSLCGNPHGKSMAKLALSNANQWRVFAIAVLVTGVLAVLSAGWLAGRDAEATLGRQVSATAVLQNAVLQSELERQQATPSILARDPDVLGLLASPSPERVAQVNSKFETLAREVRSAAIYVMDAEGRALAASNWRQPISFVGSDYSFRPYFAEAMASGRSAFFALGTVSGRPGLYLARRIDRPNGTPAGVIVTKVEFDALEAQWRAAGEPTYVTDADGVVLITTMPDWRFRTTRPLSGDRRREIAKEQTAGATLIDLPFRAESQGLVRISQDIASGQYFHATAATPDLDWTLHVLAPANATLARAIGAARGLALLSVLLLAGLAGWMLRRRHRAAQRTVEGERARAELEQRVDLRTGELRLANERLHHEADERRRLEAARQALQDDLIQATKLATLGQIAAGVAHEINQPLAAIRTHADSAGLYLDQGDASSTARSLDRIADLTERVGRITDELRAFSRKSASAVVPVDLDTALNGALLLLGSRLREQAIHLYRTGPRGLWVAAERVRLEQVLVNLIQNAAEALAGRNEPSIHCCIEVVADQVIIRVSDNGPGLSAPIREKLFTPFATDKPAGMGLGLVISRDIVTGFGGELDHETSSDGAVFRITLNRSEP